MVVPRHYTLIVPRADRTGPTNVAVDLGNAAAKAGWKVDLLFLSGQVLRDDLEAFADVRQLKLADLTALGGVVHTHGLRPDLVGWLLSWNRKCTVVTTLHGHFPQHLTYDHAHWQVAIVWAIWRWSLRRFAARVCISHAMRRHYQRQLPGLTFDVAYNSRSQPAEVAPLPEPLQHWLQGQRAAQRLVLAYVGALSARKNVGFLLQAVADTSHLCLVLCGRGPLEGQIAAMSKQPELNDRVLMLGQVSNASAVIAQSDMLVLASYAEGFPLVVLEAASVDRRSLLSNIAVHRELAVLGLGATFARGSTRDFARAATQLATRPHDGTTSALWKDRFSPQAGFSRYEEIFGQHPAASTHHHD